MSYSSQDLHKKILGKRGEQLVEEYVKKQGMRILKRNYRTPVGEADIIAQDGDEVAFIEVKTRTDDLFGAPKDALTKQKKERYLRIAKWYSVETKKLPNARFDVAEVYADGTIEYIKNAF